MSLALHFVFILASIAFVARGLPTTKQTAIERPILKKSQPTIGEPTASRWPTLAEVITNAGNGIKPSASLLDMLHDEAKVRGERMTTAKEPLLLQEPLTPATITEKIQATVIDVAELGITDFGWNEDNIKLDFITVNDLRRLIEKAGGKLDHSLYAQSATHRASLTREDKIKLGMLTTTTTTTSSTSTTSTPSTTITSLSTTTSPRRRRKFSTSWLPSVSFNITTTTTTTESTPSPPLTLSLGAWQITEEDLPIYVGSAAGVLLLIILLLGVTTWRCCTVPSNAANLSPLKETNSSSPTSQNNNGQQQQRQAPPRRLVSVESPDGNGAGPAVDFQPQKKQPPPPLQQQPVVAGTEQPVSAAKQQQQQQQQKQPEAEAPESPGTSRFIVNLSSVIADECQKSSHDSMVCLTSGTRVESRIVSPGHNAKSGSSANKVAKQSPVATLTHRRTTPFDANCSPTRIVAASECDELRVVNNASPATYVRVAPIDNYVSTSNGATTFHTFQPVVAAAAAAAVAASTSDKNSTSSSPDDAGCYVGSTTGNKGSSLSTPGTVRSTPSSEALDVVADLRYECLRFRSLPAHKNDGFGLGTFCRETNGNLLDGPGGLPQPAAAPPPPAPLPHHSPEPNMSVPLVGLKPYHNGNTNIEDLYAKINFTAKNKSRDSPTSSGQVAVVQPLSLNRIAQKMSPSTTTGSGVMTTFVPKAGNGNMMMMTSSTIVTSFDETDDMTEDSSSDPKGTSSHMSVEESSSLFYSTKTSL